MEFVGQEHVAKVLISALSAGRLAHAYLFCGPRGVGKTTIARILAKAANCESRKEGSFEPCNKCKACQEINDGRSLDLIEIDAASNRGIDEIRELREGIKFSPTRLKYKVFIIDEVHQLTPPAFNALLKTLEEPPAHAIFILATTEIHKVPKTIISRCQRFDFHKLTLEKIVDRLAKIAKAEGVKIEKSALEMIAANADGAMRDAESLLGQVMAMQDEEITLEEVKTLLGSTDISAAIEMADYLIAKDAKSAIIFVNKILEDGYDLEQFAKSLTNYLRKVMILKVDAGLTDLVARELTAEHKKNILEQAQKLSFEDLSKMIRLFLQAEYEIKNSILPQLPLELVVVEMMGESVK